MKYGIIKVKRAFLYEENGVDVVDEVFFGWSVMWEDEGEWIEVWTHYGYRGWMERNLIEEKSREWMEEREKAGNTYVVTRGFADVMRGARVQARMLETLGRGCFVEKMEKTENGYCRVKLANGISGFVPEVALRKRLDSDRFLWGRALYAVDQDEIQFSEIHIHGVDLDGYVLFYMARDLYRGSQHISLSELIDPELVSDQVFERIVTACLIRRYGSVVLQEGLQ